MGFLRMENALECERFVHPSFALKNSLHTTTTNAFQCYRQHNSWMFHERKRWKKNLAHIHADPSTYRVGEHILFIFGPVFPKHWKCEPKNTVLSIASSSYWQVADSRSLTGLILRRVMKKRFLSHLFPSLYAFIILLFFALSSSVPLNPRCPKMVWNKNYIFYVDVSLLDATQYAFLVWAVMEKECSIRWKCGWKWLECRK